MRPERILELLAPYLAAGGLSSAQLSKGQLQDISTYIDLLMRWNSRVNLTAIRAEEEIVQRHFGESLFAARCLFPAPAEATNASGSPVRLADLGSGAGFPGIPIKLWAPSLALTLIESNHKKAAFLSEVVRALTLMNVNIKNVRAETLSESFDVVTLRAVERIVETLPVAARLLRAHGRMALLISLPLLDPVRSALPQVSWSIPVPIPVSNSRVLLVGSNQV